jgi:hypothetical protein
VKLKFIIAALTAVTLIAGAGGAQAATPRGTTSTTSTTTGTTGGTSTTPKWPGHQPGKVILGMSCGSACADKEKQLGQAYGVHRQFGKWGDWSRVGKKIAADHAAGRLPWVSVEGPDSGTPAGWRALAAGKYDSEVKALATTLKAYAAKPVILTFHHEPSNDGTEAEGLDWAQASNRFYYVLNSNGALANVAYAPVLGDWLFNAANKSQAPENWLKPAVLRRASFVGIDLYENASGETFAQRLPRILNWLSAQGFPDLMVGIGETGGTDALYPKKSAVQFMNESFTWAQNNTDKIGVVSYFNSTANSRTGVYWPLDETSTKLNTYRGWLGAARFAS